MINSKTATALLLALTTILLAIQVFFNQWIVGAVTYITMLFMLLSVLTGVYAFRIHGIDSVQGKIILALTGFTMFDFLGFLTWQAYDLLGWGMPIVSAGDAFWILGYVLAIWGISMVPKVSTKQLGRGERAVMWGGWAVLLALLAYMSYATLKGTELSPVEITLSLGYFVLDTLILGMLLKGIVYVRKTPFAKGWAIIFLSFLALAAGDILYTFDTSITAESVSNFFWMLNGIFIAFGFYIYRKSVDLA